MAKTDWMLDDTVLPEDMNQIGEEINANADKLADNLDKQSWGPVTLKSGVQVVQGGEVPAILHPTMPGRTLVNLLGRDGNCEDLSKWSPFPNASVVLDTTNKVYGTSSIKLTQTTTVPVGAYGRELIELLKTNSYYLVVAEIKNGTATSGGRVRLRVYDGMTSDYFQGADVSNSQKFELSFVTLRMPTGKNSGRVEFVCTGGAANQFVYVDGIRLYEITVAEKTYIDGLTTAAAQAYIATKYPYVDDMKHVNAVYIENKGKNLLPPFSEWTIHTNSVVNGPYSLNHTTSSASAESSFVYVPVIVGQSYTLSFSGNGKAIIAYLDNSTGIIGRKVVNGGTAVTFTPPAGCVFAAVNFGNLSSVTDETNPATYVYAAGTFTFTDPMLNIGSEALPFEPQKPSYLYLPDCNLRSNVDGSVTDRLYTDGQGKPRVTRRLRGVALDGSLLWEFAADSTGYKTVKSAFTGAVQDSATVIKYDGKVLANVPYGVSATSADSQALGGSPITAFITIADTDSGWGDSYTPTADEIKAYFYGWEMGTWNSGTSTFTKGYTGTGTKAWRSIGDTHPSNGIVGVNVPTQMASGFNYTPYRLMYQLAQSVDEPVTYEGSLMLHEGDNQIEVGTGIVVREDGFTPKWDAGSYHINPRNADSFYGTSRLRHDVHRWIEVYRGSEADKYWTLYTSRASCYEQYYDSTAAYSVTYLALDTYTLGIAPQTINAEYAPNIRESVESLVREVVEARTEVSVLRNTKAQKQQPQWIAPVLRNDWVNYGGGYPEAGYYKDDLGRVHVKGMIKDGTIGTNAFYFPVGYRPKDVTYSAGSSNINFALVRVFPDGSFRVDSGINADIEFNFSFRAEQ